MATNINCTNCGREIATTSPKCICGYKITEAQLKLSTKRHEEIENTEWIDPIFSEIAITYINSLPTYNLDCGYYFLASSIKYDFERKVNFIIDKLNPSIQEWSNELNNSKVELGKLKTSLYQEIHHTTATIITEFLGPLHVSNKEIKIFNDFNLLSLNTVFKTCDEYNIDISTIQTTTFSSIGENVLKSSLSIASNSFNQIALNSSEFTKNDFNKLKNDLKINAAAQILTGLTNMLTQNIAAIKEVRKIDRELNSKVEKVLDFSNNLSIEQNEFIKKMKSHSKAKFVFEQCLKKIILPVIKEMNKNPLYIEYKSNREPFDHHLNRIQFEENILKTKVSVSFWKAIFYNQSKLFQYSFNKRLKISNKSSDYQISIQKSNHKPHELFEDLINYRTTINTEFKLFEKKYRNDLKNESYYIKNISKVLGFAYTLKTIKEQFLAS